MPSRIPSVDPAKYPDETFELWSIPAFDAGSPEITLGAGIGSSKKCVEPNDVLLSRIVPHIRRSCVVQASNGHRQIASGEWITFRGDIFEPNYLRHILISDPFHAEFMQTVAGVGGSLLRARPEGVKSIQIPLPPLEEQRRIAGILDQADALRRLRTRALGKLNTLGQAIFHEMFGENATKLAALDDVCVKITDGTHQTPTYAEDGVIFLSAKNVTKRKIDWKNTKFIGQGLHEEISARIMPTKDDVLLAKNGTTGVAALVENENVFSIYVSLALLRPNKNILPKFLLYAVNDPNTKRQFDASLKGVGVSNLHLGDIRKVKIPLPSEELQNKFVKRIEKIEKAEIRCEHALIASHALFASLQHRAFRGEL
jgi:type I restriction enzyme S subunit